MPTTEVAPAPVPKAQSALKMPIVIKIGGSSFSSKIKKVDYSSQIFPLVARNIPRGTAAVIVLGGGYKAHEYADKTGLGIRKENQQDAVEGKQAEWATISYIIDKQMTELRDAMRAEPYRHPVMPLSAASHFKRLGGMTVLMNSELIHSYLESGFIPAFHGDGVPDSARKRSILSGDNMVIEILNSLPVGSRGIFCTDVPGVLKPGALKPDVQPSKSDVIKRLRVDQLSGVKTKRGTQSTTDVTGLMGGKLAAVHDLRRGRSVQIIGIRDVNGNPIEGELAAAIAGRRVGTLIES